MARVLFPLLMVLGSQVQEDTTLRARELVAKLGSDRVEEREEAARKLEDLGSAALPELEKAVRSADVELSERSHLLLKRIRIRLRLTPNLVARIPGIVERLASGDDHAWTAAFLEMADRITVEQDPPDTAARPAGGKGMNRHTHTVTLPHPDVGKALPLKGEDARVFVLPAILASKTAEERDSVFWVIEERNLHLSLPDLLSLLKDKNSDIRSASIKMLARHGSEESRSEIRRALKDPMAGVRATATRSLGILGGQDIVPDLLTMLEDSSAEVRSNAADVLGDLGVKEAVPALVKHLEDPAAEVRSTVALVLGNMDAKEAVPSLLKNLEDPEPRVRGHTMMSLGWLDAQEAVSALLKHLEDPDPDVRGNSVWALGTLKAKEAAPAVAKLLQDRQNVVRTNCVRVLSKLKGKDAVPNLEKALEDEDIQVQRAAMEELGILRAREAIPAVSKLLSSPAGSVRSAAAISLCTLGSRSGVPTLLAASTDLGVLNRLRRPNVCDRLEERDYSGDVQGPRITIVERMAHEVGMRVEWPKDSSGKDLPGVTERCDLSFIFPGEKALSCLFRAIQDCEFDLVLENDHIIRVLPHEQALAFWKAWWASEEKTK
jgi:HEAT repeat protein